MTGRKRRAYKRKRKNPFARDERDWDPNWKVRILLPYSEKEKSASQKLGAFFHAKKIYLADETYFSKAELHVICANNMVVC